ncbi:LysM peptidoglycan-binding domain-containing protein [Carnobacteriaceae bacterium zg-ZUI78]|nr:LysM peptidoglycan-binding domain-containing protein [Carnobacteriaceae bacterium zg-ZUI78]
MHLKNLYKKMLSKTAVAMTILTMTAMFIPQSVTVHAESTVKLWEPRSIQHIRQSIQKTNEGMKQYTVQFGDTLFGISWATNIPFYQLLRLNDVSDGQLLKIGTVLTLNEDETQLTIEREDYNKIYDLNTGKEIEQVKFVENPVLTPASYSLNQFMFLGIINWSGYKFTYYSQSVLPGGGLRIPGRHVNANGYVVDGDGYIVLANNAPIGTVIDTPFGAKGKVYDRGTVGNHFDVYIR